ncbi:unnamed protein product [Urochloa decumbens]|uniref:DUF4220 domain-containing protein n=1 Tax=Urochloa decumbens TaxID=240449 RepID=A0ABC9BVW5_9POAL
MPQVTIAIYVFVKSWWFHDQRLLRASILLFVPGVIKCLEKPWALRNATATSIADSSDPQMAITMEEEEDAMPPTGNSLDGYVRGDERPAPVLRRQDERRALPPLRQPRPTLLRPAQEPADHGGAERQGGGARPGPRRRLPGVRSPLHQAQGELRRRAARRRRDPDLPDIGLFEATRRCLAVRPCRRRRHLRPVVLHRRPGARLRLHRPGLRPAGDRRQGRAVQPRRHLVFLLGVKDQLDLLWCTAPHQPTRRVTELVHDHVAGGWKGIASVADYHRFNDSRGQRSLRGGGLDHLEWSLRMPFDESVLVWHLGTELCYFNHVWHARVIYNYMTYLLFARPWMLIFRAVYIELREMLKEEEMSELEDDDDDEEAAAKRKSSPIAMDGIAQKIIQKLRNPPTSSHPRQLIQGVWVEMLCFSAARCRGNLHARSLGEGGEYLSHVWLLLSYMGMETMAERMQRTAELAPVEGDVGALVKTSDPDDDDEDDQPAAQGRPAAPPGAAGTASAAVAPAAMAVSVSAVVPVLGDDDNV